ncbi:MAG: ExeA family protein [Gammaproteobacteria bacterium]
MYVDHFKLSGRTFTDGPEAGFFTANGQVETAVARLRQVMLARDSMAIVTGGPGVGKSAIIAAAHASVEDRTAIAAVDLRQTNADMLVDMLLLRLGADAGDGNTATALHRLRNVISEHNQAGRRVTAVIDVTGLTVDRAKRVLQLIHMAGEPGGQMNIILLGAHSLHKLMNAPGLIHLRQRVGYRYRVRPLDVDEVNRYLEDRFERAGTDVGSVLDNGAAAAVFRFVGGVPRLINTLMDSVMSEAAVRGDERIGPDLVDDVARELGWKPLAGGKSAAAKPAAAKPAREKAAKSSLSQDAPPAPAPTTMPASTRPAPTAAPAPTPDPPPAAAAPTGALTGDGDTRAGLRSHGDDAPRFSVRRR